MFKCTKKKENITPNPTMHKTLNNQLPGHVPLQIKTYAFRVTRMIFPVKKIIAFSFTLIKK